MMSDRSLREGGTIYVTSHVCFGCAKLIANSGITRVVVSTDEAHTHRNPAASYKFLQECGLEVDLQDNILMSVRIAGKQDDAAAVGMISKDLAMYRAGERTPQLYDPVRLVD